MVLLYLKGKKIRFEDLEDVSMAENNSTLCAKEQHSADLSLKTFAMRKVPHYPVSIVAFSVETGTTIWLDESVGFIGKLASLSSGTDQRVTVSAHGENTVARDRDVKASGHFSEHQIETDAGAEIVESSEENCFIYSCDKLEQLKNDDVDEVGRALDFGIDHDYEYNHKGSFECTTSSKDEEFMVLDDTSLIGLEDKSSIGIVCGFDETRSQADSCFTSQEFEGKLETTRDIGTITEVCSAEDPDEVEILSLVQEQIPRYRLRADTVSDFTGYRNTDFLHTGAHNGVCDPSDEDLSPEQIEGSLNYFGELCLHALSGDGQCVRNPPLHGRQNIMNGSPYKKRELKLTAALLLGGVGSTVACESALSLQGPFCRGFEPRYRRPDLTEGLKA
ncbi:trafficking kinesin-binding protein 1 [Plakobranchus ocellatus]|uniref:Trafficking kinesin-binding protein 1 n=1 Tax=Plakobranchus ocellatus TaxID=259542 RepID=A0AAV4AGA6_9GAST|nr:trafficking kinesin-binding protein 1 [Plakobranchus ocellatus]